MIFDNSDIFVMLNLSPYGYTDRTELQIVENGTNLMNSYVTGSSNPNS